MYTNIYIKLSPGKTSSNTRTESYANSKESFITFDISGNELYIFSLMSFIHLT